MDKLLDGIIKNIEDTCSKGDFKSFKGASILLDEYVKDENIKELNLENALLLNGIISNAENTLLPLTISRGEIRDAKLIMYTIKTLKNILSNKTLVMGCKFKHKDTKVDKILNSQWESASNSLNNKAEKLLNESINNKVLITTYDESTRGIGKSKALVVKANELDCTLVTHNHTSKRYLDEIAQGLNIPVEVKYYNNVDNARGSRMRNGKFLVDECVSKDVIKVLMNNGNELLGGFVNLHTNETDITYAKVERKLNELENELWVFHKLYGDYSKNKYEYNDVLNKIKALKWLLNELK